MPLLACCRFDKPAGAFPCRYFIIGGGGGDNLRMRLNRLQNNPYNILRGCIYGPQTIADSVTQCLCEKKKSLQEYLTGHCFLLNSRKIELIEMGVNNF